MSGVAMACLEALAFSSVLAACVAGALTLAAAGSLSDSPSQWAASLAFAGTLVVYNIDRLRDLERDRPSAPRRSAFVTRHRTALSGLVLLGGSAAAALAWRAGPATAALCSVLLLPSLFHRRIKHHPVVKTCYVTAAWVGVLLGLPVLHALGSGSTLSPPLGAGGEVRIALVAAIYGAAIGANLIASNVRDSELPTSQRNPIWTARGLAAAGVLLALAGPAALRPLGFVPLAQLAGLTGFRPGERARLIVVDGSLLLGGLGALGVQAIR